MTTGIRTALRTESAETGTIRSTAASTAMAIRDTRTPTAHATRIATTTAPASDRVTKPATAKRRGSRLRQSLIPNPQSLLPRRIDVAANQIFWVGSLTRRELLHAAAANRREVQVLFLI